MYWHIGIAIAFAVIIILLMWYWYYSEKFVGYLDQMAMKNPDPDSFFYFGDNRDILGMSARDYYLENVVLNDSEGIPWPADEAMRFVNRTGYQELAQTFRPVSNIGYTILSDN